MRKIIFGLFVLVASLTVFGIACGGQSPVDSEIARLGKEWSFQPLTFEYDDQEFNVLYAEDTSIHSPDIMEVLVLTHLDTDYASKFWVAYDLKNQEVLYTIYTRKDSTTFEVPRDEREIQITRNYEVVFQSELLSDGSDFAEALIQAILKTRTN